MIFDDLKDETCKALLKIHSITNTLGGFIMEITDRHVHDE